jgi:uncharacterized protein YlxW (UPF0749 family)
MVKRLVLLALLLTLSLPSFSQTVTQSKDTQVVVLPVKVAREVVKDLMRGDSAIAQLSLANIQITQLELKVTYQDSVIQKLKTKEDNYITLVDSERRKNEILNDEIKTTQKELRKVKTKKTFSQIISGAIILTLSYLYITK